MTSSSRKKDLPSPRAPAPGPDDPVLSSLHEAEASYREWYIRLEQQDAAARESMARAQSDNQALRQELEQLRDDLDAERRQLQQRRETAETVASALKEIHRSLFSNNIFELILKTCLALTGATRGMYITTGAKDGAMRVRAAIDVQADPSSSPSSFITSLCRAALEQKRVITCSDVSVTSEDAAEIESFTNCVAAPVVLRGDLNGIVIVADKAGGEFDERDAELLVSIGNQAAVAIENTRLQREVEDAYMSIVTLLAETMAVRNQQARHFKDSECRIARRIAAELGLPEYEQSLIYYAALLHDIGNIGVSDGVLNKPGPLLEAERDLVRTHTQIGHDLLHEIPVLDAVAGVVRHHHERFDGSGYPDGLQGEAIPIAARIVAVVDAYEAMLASRSYRPARTSQQACAELRAGAGTQFDPAVVEVFLAILDTAEPWSNRSHDIGVKLPGLDVWHGQRAELSA